jgi:hypothetical protein
VRAQDLKREAKQLFEEWRQLGYTERQALDRVERSGLVREPELYETLRGVFGLSQEAARTAALGRNPEPADDHGRVVENLKSSFGLSDRQAQIAADGRDGPTVRPVSEAGGQGPQPGDNQRLIALVEQWQQDLLARGQLCIERGECRELAALREAYGKVFLAAQNDVQRLWMATVVEAYWPELATRPGSGGGSKNSQTRSVGETTRQPGRRTVSE